MNKNYGFWYDDKKIYGYTLLNLDFVTPNEDCDSCRCFGDVCFGCEMDQVQQKYNYAIYSDDCEWIIKKKFKNKKGE